MTSVTAPDHSPGIGRGAWVGLLTAWVALGVAQLIAGIGRPQGSPVAAVGGLAIDNTPPPVKNFAIATFGSNDKKALVVGMLVVLAVLAAGIGIAAMRRLSYGFIGLGIFAAIGLAGALTRPNAEPVDVLPTLIGMLAGAFALSRLVRTAHRSPRAAPVPAGPVAADEAPAREAPTDEASAGEAPADTGPPPGQAGAAEPTQAPEPADHGAPDGGPPAPAEPERGPLDWVPAAPSQIGRAHV